MADRDARGSMLIVGGGFAGSYVARKLGRYKEIASVFGFQLKRFLGWWITRTYHVYQLPLPSRKLRVVTDWTIALLFRRDIAELGVLERPRRLGG
jgi:NADH dehydrogenase